MCARICVLVCVHARVLVCACVWCGAAPRPHTAPSKALSSMRGDFCRHKSSKLLPCEHNEGSQQKPSKRSPPQTAGLEHTATSPCILRAAQELKAATRRRLEAHELHTSTLPHSPSPAALALSQPTRSLPPLSPSRCRTIRHARTHARTLHLDDVRIVGPTSESVSESVSFSSLPPPLPLTHTAPL